MNEPGWLIVIGLAYLSGSVPYALLIGRGRGVDLRRRGSGNVGASNCGRVLGARYGVACFVLDAAKGFGPVFAGGWWMGVVGDAGGVGGVGGSGLGTAEAAWWLGAGVAAVLGHVAPVWLGFRGGKGVATGFGVILGVWPYLTMPAFAAAWTWLLFASTLRYVSLASVLAAASLPAYFALAAAGAGWPMDRHWPLLAAGIAMALLIGLRHRGNLRRLGRGTEPRLGG